MNILILFGGVIIGLFAAAFIMVKYMIVTIYMPGMRFKEVDSKLREIVPQFKGWSFPIPPWEFYKSQIFKGFKYDNIKNMNIHFVCKPAHANSMLRKYPHSGGIMPCSWAVYETTDGKVYISKMNIALMSMVYPGFIGKIMKDVAQTEKAMLSRIKDKKEQESPNINFSIQAKDKDDDYATV